MRKPGERRSSAGWLPPWKLSAYAASKAAVSAYAEVLAAECRASGVKIRCVCPALVDTPQYRQLVARDPTVAGRAVSASAVVDAVERSLANDRLFVFPGRDAKLGIAMRRYFPWLLRVADRRTGKS